MTFFDIFLKTKKSPNFCKTQELMTAMHKLSSKNDNELEKTAKGNSVEAMAAKALLEQRKNKREQN